MKIGLAVVMILIAVAILLTGTVFIYYPQVVTKMIADKNKVDVNYASVVVLAPDRFLFKRLAVIDRKSGYGVNAKEAVVKLYFMPKPDWIYGINFECKDATFVTAGGSTTAGFDSLSALTSAPFSGSWTYGRFSGELIETRDRSDFKKIMAESNDLRFQIDGKMYEKSKISCDIVVYFNERLLGKTPQDVSAMFLEKGKDGWVGMPVHIEGDYKTTAFKVSSKRFRLSITPK